ncbi:MAG TPA: aldo/keto reductase [Acidimicrobiales bacterium]|nr:aldo/keto reductase [Acidimicrobiales bacterium]
MNYRTFGRTGLMVSSLGLGGGGASRLGLATGSSVDEVRRLIQRSFELGVNYFDTADNYGTEEVLGQALAEHRNEVVFSSKVYPRLEDGSLLAREELRPALEASLKRLSVDVLDVYHLHGVSRKDYEYCQTELVPELVQLKDSGLVRFLGISERNSSDSTHAMLQLALGDDIWDVVMVGFNLFNQSAREQVLRDAIRNNVAVEVMASARNQFSRPELFVEDLVRLVESGAVTVEGFERDNPWGFLESLGSDVALTDISYRFAAHEPGVHVVLVGTGNIAHLEENIKAFNAGELPSEVTRRLIAMFGHLANTVVVPGRVLRPE